MQARLVIFEECGLSAADVSRCLTGAGYLVSDPLPPPESLRAEAGGTGTPVLLEIELPDDAGGRRADEPRLPSSGEQAWLIAILRSISAAVITTDPMGRVTLMNPRAEHLTGKRLEDAIGLPLDQVCRVTNGDTEERPDDPLARVRETGRDVRLAPQALLVAGARKAIPVDGSAAPILTEGGSLRGYVLAFRDATDHRRADEALRQSAERYRTLVELSPDAIVVHGGGRILFVNTAAVRLLRAERPEEVIGRPVLDFVHPDFHELVKERIQDMTQTSGRAPSITEKFLALDGTELDVEVTAAAIPLGEAPAIMVITRDIKERKEAQDALRRSEERLRLLAENMLDVITQTDALGIITYQSPSVRTVLGLDAADLLGQSFHVLCHPDDQAVVEAQFRESTESGTPLTMECRCRHGDGGYSWLETVGNPLFDAQDRVVGMVLNSRDITARRQMEEQLKYLSLHDALTGLYNRTYFEQEMQRLDGGRSTTVGAIVCDVDGLKFVNDTLGHERGDALLSAVAEVFRKSFRAGDVIARIGGDEFAVLLPGTNKKDVDGAVRRIKAAVQSHNAGHPDFPVSLSIGAAVSRDRKTTMAGLVSAADNHMYREKLRSGRSTRNAIINVIFRALKARDVRTDEHSERLQDLVTAMAQSLALPEETVSDLRLLARFHDIGKVGISESILSKPGPLTAGEIEEMRRHSEIGHRIAQAAPELSSIAEWILRHHEWWNGQGYPGGIKGPEIPLECRILAIVDAFDAMTSDRPYRKPLTPQAAVQELERCAGTQFDPELVERFLRMVEKAAR